VTEQELERRSSAAAVSSEAGGREARGGDFPGRPEPSMGGCYP
jgi:hypothetical protein